LTCSDGVATQPLADPGDLPASKLDVFSTKIPVTTAIRTPILIILLLFPRYRTANGAGIEAIFID
jgi:hypothetical protein